MTQIALLLNLLVVRFQYAPHAWRFPSFVGHNDGQLEGYSGFVQLLNVVYQQLKML